MNKIKHSQIVQRVPTVKSNDSRGNYDQSCQSVNGI